MSKTKFLFFCLLAISAVPFSAQAENPPATFTAISGGGVTGNYQVPGYGWCGDSGGAPETFQFSFNGETKGRSFPGCCGIYYTPYFLYITNQLSVGTHMGVITPLVQLEFCGASMLLSGNPSCISVDISRDPETWTTDDRPTGPVYFTANVYYNSNATPLAEWEIVDNTGWASKLTPSYGHYLMSADGESTAVATIINNGGNDPVTLSFVGDSLGCSLSGNTLTAGTEEGTVQVQLQFDNEAHTNICEVKDYFFDLVKGCSSCSGGGPTATCDNYGLNSVNVKLDLGASVVKSGNTFLQIKSDYPDVQLGTPASLRCAFIRPELERITNSLGWVRQVRTLDRVVDVVTNSATSYSMLFYNPTNLLNTKTNGLYQFTNSPYKTVAVELVGGDTNHVRFTSSLEMYPFDYVWQGNGWALTTGSGARTETITVTTNGSAWTKLRTIKNAQNDVEYQVAETTQLYSYGERVVQRVVGSGSSALTNSFAYTTNGLLEQSTGSDGSWDIYAYDSLGRQTAHYSPFLNSAPTTNSSLCRVIESTYTNSVVSGSGDNAALSQFIPRQVVEYVLGQEISRSYTVVKTGERWDIRCATAGAAWNATNNLTTKTYLRTDYLYQNQPSKILIPDGTMQLFAYGKGALPGTTSPTYTKTTIDVGATNGSATAVTDGTRQETWVDVANRTLARRSIDILSGLMTDLEVYSYDKQGRLTNTVYLDGTSTKQSYDCCHLESTTGRDGTVTSYSYDVFKRLLTATVNGITTSNIYNANDAVIGIVRYGTDSSTISQGSTTFDDAGRMTASMDALGNTTAYTNHLDGSGQMIRSTTYPNLTTRTETYARDGQLLKVVGTAVHGMRYDYGVESEGGSQRLYTKEIQLDGNGDDTLQWSKSYTDALGRNYKTVLSAASGTPSLQSYYNGRGQLVRQVDPDGVTTLFEYNAKGELEYQAVDFYGDGQLHKDGSNRVSQTTSDVVSNATYGVVRRTFSYVWPTTGVDFPRAVTSQESTADRRLSWSMTWNNSSAVTNFSSSTYAGNGLRYLTNRAPDGSYAVSVYQFGRLLSTTRKDANNLQITATTFGYDAHGRNITATDARNGTTTIYYNAADQAVSTLSPVPGAGQSAQLTTNALDSMGRVWRTTLPDSTSVTNEYFDTGELKKTYGSRTYPVEYTYDAQGRMKTMTTWTNYASGTGAAVTTWNYDPYRGFLTNKAYADGIGPAYTYTAAGRLATRVWARGITSTYGYNAAGDLQTINYSDGVTPNVTNAFDRLGQLASVTRDGAVCSYDYNGAGQLLSENNSGGLLNGLSVTNVYDALLRRMVVSAQASGSPLQKQEFGYDKASRLHHVKSGQSVVAYAYAANSPLVEAMTFWQDGNQRMTTTKTYDNLNRLTAISSVPGTQGQVPSSYAYGYNAANQRTAVTNTDASRWSYGYDNLGQVINGKKYWSDGTPVAGQQFEYAFDDIGNRTATKAGGDASGANLRPASYSVNNLNQYTSRTVPGAVDILGAATNVSTVTVNGQSTYRKDEYYRAELALTNDSAAVFAGVTNIATLGAESATNLGSVFLPQTPEAFGYDADGNITNDGRWTYTWDAENRLLTMTSLAALPSAAKRKLDFAYDYRGRRIQKTVSAWTGSAYTPQSTNRFLYDGWNVLAVLDPQSSIVESFIWGLDLSGTLQGAGGVGGLLAVTAPSGTHFCTYDGNGNVAALVSGVDGTTSATYEYGPFGELLRATGPMAKVNPFRFSTKYQDDETDQLYYGYRFYNASVGRWLSRDTINEQGGKNLYGFLQNSGLNHVDINGEIGLDTALDLLVLGVDLSTGAGLATIALDVAALAIPLAPNPRGGIVISRLIKGERRSFELVDHALLREVASEPGIKGIEWNDVASRPQQASIVLEYRGRLRNQAGNVYSKHFEYFAKTDVEAKAASFRDSFFAPGVDDRQVRIMIDEALRQHRASFGQTFFRQLDGYVYNAGLPYGSPNSLRLNVGYDRGQCTTKIKLKVGKDGSIHAHPTIDPATPSGSVIPITH